MGTVSSHTAIIRGEDQGERRWFYGGGLHIWKAKAEETGGAFLLFEDQMSGGKMTPLHTHPDSDESMYILEGEILMHLDGQQHRIGAGGLAVAPRGVPHAFMVVSAFARMLCLHTPGSCQAFYWDASIPLGSDAGGGPAGDGPTANGTGPHAGPVDFGKVQESARKNGGIEILGPPPFASTPRAEGS
jgi:mannose-6-phosphate isomerase-like protein (cupin superfamily)